MRLCGFLFSVLYFLFSNFYLLLPEDEDDERLLPELLEEPDELLVTELPLLLVLEPLLL